MKGLVSKATAVYMGEDKGPFRCGRCEYFDPPDACKKVAGNIDPDGCCNFFEPNPKADKTGHLLKIAMQIEVGDDD